MKSAASLFDLRGRVVIVTGGAVGIGAVYSERLVEAGARVVVADVAAAESEHLAARLGKRRRDTVGADRHFRR